MTVSVCIICKNEEKVLARCLESVKGLDEIVVVDTGSTDKTKEIAKKYTDKVFDFEWCDNFALARNFGLEHCTSDWVLILDADEFVPTIDGLKALCLTPLDAISCVVYNKGKRSHEAVRVIRKHIRYRYAIHEYPVIAQMLKSEFRVDHDKVHKNDPARNIRILTKALEADPNETRYMYYLGSEYFSQDKWAECATLLEKYVRVSKYPAEKCDALYLLGIALTKLKRRDNAIIYALLSIFINPQFEEGFKLLATLSAPMYRQRWKDFASTANNQGVIFMRESKEVHKGEKA